MHTLSSSKPNALSSSDDDSAVDVLLGDRSAFYKLSADDVSHCK
jgi:hypothetical protein